MGLQELEEIRLLEELEEQKKREEQEKLEKILSSVPDEPAPGESGVSMLNIRLPNGKRLERRFYNSNSLQDVYNFILSKGEETQFVRTDFDLVTAFPRHIHGD